jgi:signal transduction histidine kinase
MVLLLARRSSAEPGNGALQAALGEPALLDAVQSFLPSATFVNWNQLALWPIYQTCLAQACLAQSLAGLVAGCDAACAWAGGLLAPLGWLTACAVSPAAVAWCRQHPDFPRQAAAVQRQAWGLDHTAIARRLCRCWGLPAWLSTIIGHLGLPAGIAHSLGADATLFQVVQLAVSLVQHQGKGLGLVVGGSPSELMSALRLSQESVERAVDNCRLRTDGLALTPWEAPESVSLLLEYLCLARRQRFLDNRPLIERLQSDVDHLQRALEQRCAGEQDRLHNLKMSALAEMAAGAGHEINNPLAVISGQAQYLMGRETEPERCKALQAIIGQTRRIHQILFDLMQFAKPAAPQPQLVEAAELLPEVVVSLRDLADQLQVQLVCPEPPAGIGRLHVDPIQVRHALQSLLRNAIEAAPAEGWAGIRVRAAGAAVEFLIEDNGLGPTPAAREHMFDPFFSGRSAGRGRGLGLATAWRLAQHNGGSVRFDEDIHPPTRFILRLPLAPESHAAQSIKPHANGHASANGVAAQIADCKLQMAD